jgi:transcriptional regulator with XRE-family HTH domain
MSQLAVERWAGTVARVATGDEEIGRAIKRRRLALGMDVKDLAEEAKVDRGRLSAWEKGEGARESSIAQVLRALDRLEAEIVGPYDNERDIVTFRLQGNFGVDVTLQGPVSNLDELEASVTRLLRSMGDPSVKRPHPDDA